MFDNIQTDDLAAVVRHVLKTRAQRWFAISMRTWSSAWAPPPPRAPLSSAPRQSSRAARSGGTGPKSSAVNWVQPPTVNAVGLGQSCATVPATAERGGEHPSFAVLPAPSALLEAGRHHLAEGLR